MRLISGAFLTILLLSGATSSWPPEVKEYLGVRGPIKLNNSEFNLAWSAHPTADYYKQEYVPAHESVEKYNQMVLVEAVFGSMTIEQAVQAQIETIEARKQTDLVARYQVLQNSSSGEIILDFMMSAGSEQTTNIVEWNAYRYKSFQDKSGRKGILLFAISKRGYDEKITAFLSSLKDSRVAAISALSSYQLPAISTHK